MKHGTQLLVDKLTDEQYEEFQERCAIMEHEGRLTQDDAEYCAVMDVLGIVKVKAT
ncbi:MAG: hypothetical protein IPH49_16005 [Ignavibacteria bacterium]|nr:hypothetical protein [Ignavibacteria bacterium]